MGEDLKVGESSSQTPSSLGSTKAPTSSSKVLRYLCSLTAVRNILFNRLMIERRQEASPSVPILD